MGIKTTVTLARSQAIDRLVSLKLLAYERKLRAEFDDYTNSQLGATLEIANDSNARHIHKMESGFENYNVVD